MVTAGYWSQTFQRQDWVPAICWVSSRLSVKPTQSPWNISYWTSRQIPVKWTKQQKKLKSFFKNHPMSCSPHAAHIMCELQSWWTTACNKHLQILEKNQQKTPDCRFQEAAIALQQRYYTRQIQSSLQPPKTSAWESDYSYLKISKGLIPEHSPCCTGLTGHKVQSHH